MAAEGKDNWPPERGFVGLVVHSGIFAESLTLIALLAAGAALVFTGSTLSGTMIGFMRSNTTTATARAG